MNTNSPASPGSSDKLAVKLGSESVAGEEDPGASLDLPGAAPHGNGPATPPGAVAPLAADAQVFGNASGTLNPGDDAPAGTPGTGESICRECGGSGRMAQGPCPSCAGTGKVTVGMGGG
jgi:hypothetical protein